MRDTTQFQYCQKIVLLRNDDSEVLLARRIGEQDYNQTYTFIGGKALSTDGSIVAALKREKDEEIGTMARVSVCPLISYNVYFVKKDGNHMIVPHYYANFVGGDISLSDEYDDFVWVPIAELRTFEPKIANIPEMTTWAIGLKSLITTQDMVEI